ncbi:MAG: M20/M25/M40 family metallo-hydrolase [Bacteroidales bacterium]|nr:M20/M25/M40 family metallo-hydrolase [Bacteroidales bacterium]
MRKFTIIIAVCTVLTCSFAAQGQTQRQRLERHVYTLASDSLQGREAGSPNAEKARQYIEKEWRAMGLKPLWGDSYRMPFKLYSADGYCNLVAFIEGSDPVLKSEYIVIGGHYDHLGVKDGKVYNGADDNASGTACVTEVARQLLARQRELKRSVIVCAFDAEEIGLHGSSHLATRMKELNMIDRVKLMMSVDMVGWLKQGEALTLEGSGTLADGSAMTDPSTLGINIPIRTKRYENSIFTATDTEPFAKQGVATLAVTTGLKSPYHKPEDDADLIDYAGLSLVTDYIAAFTIRIANWDGKVGSGRVADKHRTTAKPVEFGLQIGDNSSWLRFPDAAFSGKSLAGFQGGVALQLNLGKLFAIHADLLYTLFRTRVPDLEQPFSSTFRMRQQALLLPLTLQLNIGDVANHLIINAGGYGAYFLSHDLYMPNTVDYPRSISATLPTPAEFGLTWGVGFRIGYHYQLSVNYFYPLNYTHFSMKGVAVEPRANRNFALSTLSYYF